jgi:hypothetical protein
LTYPASNRRSRTGLPPSATTASSAAPGGSATLSRRSKCGTSTCSNAPRGPKFARSCTSKFAQSCTSVSQPAKLSRTQHCCQGGQSAADRLSAVGRTTRGPHGSPGMGQTRIAHRRRGFCPHGHGALLPRQHLRCAGVRGAERTSREHRRDQVGGQPRDQHRRTGGLVAQRADPCYKPIICGILIFGLLTDSIHGFAFS